MRGRGGSRKEKEPFECADRTQPATGTHYVNQLKYFNRKTNANSHTNRKRNTIANINTIKNKGALQKLLSGFCPLSAKLF